MDAERVKKIKVFLLIVGVISGIILVPWGFDALGANPQFVKTDWIELDKVHMISKFRSTVGHGYGVWGNSNPTSDKHYYESRFDHGNSQDDIKVFSPTKSIVTMVMNEQHRLSDGSIQGKQVHLMSLTHPSITFILFHINVNEDIHLFSVLEEGQQIGYADLRDNSSTDIAVTRGGRYISYFDIMTDSLFTEYQDRGIPSREFMKKSDTEVQQSTSNDYGFDYESGQQSDPRDMVMLKATNYTKLIDTDIVDPTIIANISYATNLLMDTSDGTSSDEFSYASWFKVKDAYAGTYSNPVYVPFDVNVAYASELASPNINHSVTVRYNTENYSLEMTYYGIKKVTDLGQGDQLSAGDKIGDISDYLGIKCIFRGRHTTLSVFELMSDTIWSGWSARGMTNRSMNVVNFMEFEDVVTSSGQTEYALVSDGPWWIELN